MSNAIEIKGLNKEYDKFTLDNISFTLPEGYIMGLIGPNGAGKTTIIKLMLNMIRKSAGDITILGWDSIKDQNNIKENVSAVFDSNYFVQDWTVAQVEKSIGIFYETWDTGKFNSMLQKFGLDRDKKVKELSRGMQMKLMLSCAFSHDSKLLILDEPTSGLDPLARDELLDILSEFIQDGKRSVLFSTHITTDLDKIADYITFMNKGKMFYTGSKDEFLESFRMVKGGSGELSGELEKLLIGTRKYSTGFEGLISTKNIGNFTRFACEPVTIDDIIVFSSRGGNIND